MQTYVEHRRVKNFEAVDDDPNIIGTFDAELGRGGRVNLNRRIYPAQEFKAINEDLNRRIQEGLVAPGEEGHPNFIDGPTFKIPVILREVRTVEEAPGVVRSEGKFAITNTTSGRDIRTLHELGVPIGVSSKMYARAEAHTLDRTSEFFHANMDFEGEDVMVMRDLSFDEEGPYDLVRVPSAGTYVRSAEAVACEQRLVAEGVLSPLPEAVPAASDNELPRLGAPETAASAAPTEGADMDLQKKIDALEAELSEVRERAEKAESEAKAQADEACKAVDRAEAAEAAKTEAEDKVTSLEAALEEAQAVTEGEYADRLAELQTAHEAVREELAQVKAERATEKLAAALAKAVNEASEGDHGDIVKAELASLIGEGVLTDPEKVAAHAERIRGICAKVVTEAPQTRVVATDDDNEPEAAVVAEALGAEFVNQMNRLSAGLEK